MRAVDEFEIEAERYELSEPPRYRFDVDRREFFKLLGSGLVVLCFVVPGLAQESGGAARRRGGRDGRIPSDINAWLHIGEDGTVTVFTGKAEVGQNIRTSLTQAVAEELRVGMASIHLVMADTELTPFDMGTFGSQSTPQMASRLHRMGAAAREALLDLAADYLKVERASLVLADGKISGAGAGKSVSFGELTQGRKLVKSVTDEAAPTPAKDWKIAGTSAAKVNGRNFVTGKHKYSSDMKLPGMLHGKVLRASAFGASLESLDTQGANAMAGVTVVHDGDFVGVTSADPLTSAHALDAIRAKWSSTPQPSSVELFDYLRKNAGEGGGRGSVNSGSIEEGMKLASHKLQGTYTVAYIAHTPLEPRAAVAKWEDGKLTVWTGTQRPFGVRQELAQTFGISEDLVRVIVPDTGAGYGGKHTGEAAVEAARLAKATGKPVKLVWTRQEEFTWAYFRPAGVIDISSGVAADGTITAWEFHNYNSGGSGLGSPYALANQKCEVHTSHSPLRQGSYRALAATANHFARESHMDELARAVKMDPLDFRLKNLQNDRLRTVLEAAAEKIGWRSATRGGGHGFGLAAGTEKGSYVATCAEVLADKESGDVKVLRAVTAFDCGAVVNPNHLKNQIEGALMMGLGGALFEAMEFENGMITNPRLSDYRVPRFSDMPRSEAVLIDRKDVASAGAGETPIMCIAPAIGNAIFEASGIRLRSMPMAPDGLKG
ncbi:MAG TPA: molybdopterin cofactor-binding domain-containing protein [Verrucomicrobiae bacterium]|nr:molybdopterin cofactor-binding domain-containing protein [Verrucomicrobiae bacterium]